MTDTYHGWNVPTPATLKKYGLSFQEWADIIDRQGGVCPIMGYVPDSGGGVIDHAHVKGWKTMPPEERKKYVRGVVSRWANGKYLARGLNVERAERVVAYLRDYEARLAQARVDQGDV